MSELLEEGAGVVVVVVVVVVPLLESTLMPRLFNLLKAPPSAASTASLTAWRSSLTVIRVVPSVWPISCREEPDWLLESGLVTPLSVEALWALASEAAETRSSLGFVVVGWDVVEPAELSDEAWLAW